MYTSGAASMNKTTRLKLRSPTLGTIYIQEYYALFSMTLIADRVLSRSILLKKMPIDLTLRRELPFSENFSSSILKLWIYNDFKICEPEEVEYKSLPRDILLVTSKTRLRRLVKSAGLVG